MTDDVLDQDRDLIEAAMRAPTTSFMRVLAIRLSVLSAAHRSCEELLRTVRDSIPADQNYAGLFVEEWDALLAALATS